MKPTLPCLIHAAVAGLFGTTFAQTWPDYHLTNGTHYTSYGVETYAPEDPVKNLHVDAVAILYAADTELDNIHDGNQVFLDGGTIFASAIDEPDFTWNNGTLHLDGGTHATTYGLASGTGKALHIDSSAELDGTGALSISSGNELHINDGGKLHVGDFDASMAGFHFNDGGTLQVNGTLSDGGSDVLGGEAHHVVLNGPSAGWNTEHIGIGQESTLSILNGAVVETTTLDTYYWGNGRIEISGEGSRLATSGRISAGQDGESRNRLVIADGGRATSSSGYVGEAGGNQNTATVSGSGSAWTMDGRLVVGSGIGGDNNRLVVEEGGTVSCASAIVGGDYRGSAFNSTEINGSGSQWNIEGGFLLGWAGVGNRLSIADGGVLTSGSAIIGYDGDDYTANDNTATVSGTGSRWLNAGDLEISKAINGRTRYRGNSLTITNGGEVVVGGNLHIYNESTYDTGNQLNLDNGGRLVIGSGFDASTPGFNYNAGSTLVVEGLLTGMPVLGTDRRLEAQSLLSDLTVHGTFAPGNSPADSMLDGALTIAADGTLEMELAGHSAGSEHDRLTVSGTAYLDGTLDIVLLDGFSPAYGDHFDLFNWNGGVSGTFSAITGSPLSGGLYWDTADLYATGQISVIPEPGVLQLVVVFGGGLLIVRRARRRHPIIRRRPRRQRYAH